MDYHKLSKADLIRENQFLHQEISRLSRNQIDPSHLSAIIYDRKRTEQNFKRINEMLLGLGPHFEENINNLTRLCGELTGATCAVYNRINMGALCALGRWNAPGKICRIDKSDGLLCYEVITKRENHVIVIHDLQESSYAITDPHVAALGLRTYMGKAVICDGEFVGSICAVFQEDVEFTLEHEQIFTVISSALSNEESRNKAQKKLLDSEERFRSAFLTSPDSININRLNDGLFVDINEGFTKMTGYTRDDAIGRTSVELNLWDNHLDRLQLIEGLKNHGFVENLEAQFRIKDGRRKTALMSARLFSLQGEPHILSVSRDMTERQKALLAIKESEQRFRSVVENAFDGIYLISRDRFTYANHRFCEIIGYTAEEIEHPEFDFGTTLTDKSRDLIEQRRLARIKGENIPGIYEFEIMTKSGELKEVEVSTVKLDSQDEVMVLGIMRDITERKRLFEELIQAKDKAEEVNQLKSRLLANLSHEIRTPLNGILGFAELLREDISDASQRSMADIIYSSGYRLLHTLNAILDLSVIESQFSKINMKSVCLNHLAEEVVVLFRPNTMKKGLSITFDAGLQEELVTADEELVNKILNNLINNAIKFTQHGSITVSTCLERKGSHGFGCIQVSDTGIGIKKEHQKVIFEEFRQVSEGQTRKYDGSGLGLHISKRFAEMMGGTITVKSKPDVGSTFTLYLPLKQHSLAQVGQF